MKLGACLTIQFLFAQPRDLVSLPMIVLGDKLDHFHSRIKDTVKIIPADSRKVDDAYDGRNEQYPRGYFHLLPLPM